MKTTSKTCKNIENIGEALKRKWDRWNESKMIAHHKLLKFYTRNWRGKYWAVKTYHCSLTEHFLRQKRNVSSKFSWEVITNGLVPNTSFARMGKCQEKSVKALLPRSKVNISVCLPSFYKKKASIRKIFGARSLQFLFLCQKERWGWLGGSTICLISSYLVTLRPDRGHTTSWAIFIGGHLVNPLLIIIMKVWIIMKVIVKIIFMWYSILFWSSGQLDAKGVAIAL